MPTYLREVMEGLLNGEQVTMGTMHVTKIGEKPIQVSSETMNLIVQILMKNADKEGVMKDLDFWTKK